MTMTMKKTTKIRRNEFAPGEINPVFLDMALDRALSQMDADQQTADDECLPETRRDEDAA